jgi:hypothetical protein
MFKFLTIALAATSIGAAGATTAYACGCPCHSKTTSVSAPESAPAKTAPEVAPKSAAQAPSTGRTDRSYSYEPAMAPSSGASERAYSTPSVRRSNRSTRSEFSIDVGRRAKGY